MATLPSPKKTYIDPKDLPRVDRMTLRRILAYVRPYRAESGLVVLTILLSSALGLLPPFFVERAVDVAIPARDGRLLVLLCAGMVVGPLLAGLIGVWQRYLTASMGESVMLDLRVRLFEHLQALPYSYFVHAKPGEAMSAVLNDVQGVGSVVSSTLVKVLDGAVVLASTTAVLFLLDWRLALVTLVFLPGLVVPARPVGQARKRIRRSAQAQLAELTGLLDETLSVSGILLTRIFGAERFEAERIRRQSAEIRQLALKQALVGRWFQMFMAVFEAAGPALVFGVGGYLIMAGRVGVGTVVAFATLLKRLYSSASAVMGVQVDVVTSYAYFERVFRVLDMPRERGAGPGAIAVPQVQGALTLEGVSLEYEDGTEGLSAVDLHVPPGQCVAIVGPSGAGKSTLVALLLRLHDPTSGRVLLDGHDLRTIELRSLRSHIGVVTQETYLFHGTVLDNLLYARPGATREQIETAARAAQIHDFVASLPAGYETVVGRRGFRLSGGERQRLAIARAILKDPRILLLDEATSSLDSQNEALIEAALASLLRGRTSLVVAHRLSTVRRADSICVFDSGKIRERGKHEELLAADGLYAQLHRQQLREPASV
jgi:ATP-binding cassette, subfamily B, bacterial